MSIPFSALEAQRYSRHFLLSRVGQEGQIKLKQAKVLIVGAGGLGSPCSLYLASAGVGHLGIVDFDRVERSNLHRQILFEESDIGKSKATLAQKKLQAANPHIEIVSYDFQLSQQNALDLFKDYDLIIDGTDNFPTRYLMSDACVLSKKPLVYGSISQFEGQASFFGLPNGPCYRCVYPDPPPAEAIPNCAEAGVLGVLPGIIGVIQATEAIKWILGKGDLLQNRLLLFDALEMSFRELAIRKSLNCPICSNSPQITKLEEIPQLCPATSSSIKEVEAVEFMKRMTTDKEMILIDVRSPEEYEYSNIGGISLPLGVLIRDGENSSQLQRIEKSQRIFVHCASGIRSAKAVEILHKIGFTNIWNITGKILGL